MSSPLEIVAALVDALDPVKAAIPDLQIYPYPLSAPTPPAIDVYPGDPFSGGAGFGMNGGSNLFFTVRARVATADQDAGWMLLYELLDDGAASVENALVADQTLGGVVDSLAIGDAGSPGVSGFREYVADSAVNGRLLGCEWRVWVIT